MRRAYLSYLKEGRIETVTIFNWRMDEGTIEGRRYIMLTADAAPINMVNSVTEWPEHLSKLAILLNNDIDELPRVAPELPEDFA